MVNRRNTSSGSTNANSTRAWPRSSWSAERVSDIEHEPQIQQNRPCQEPKEGGPSNGTSEARWSPRAAWPGASASQRCLQRVGDGLHDGVDVGPDQRQRADRGDRHERQDERVLDERLTLLALTHRVDVRHDHLEHLYFTSPESTRVFVGASPPTLLGVGLEP